MVRRENPWRLHRPYPVFIRKRGVPSCQIITRKGKGKERKKGRGKNHSCAIRKEMKLKLSWYYFRRLSGLGNRVES